ncbi:cation:proton antiporter domain-containing protein [Urbifossiella limnaea]|uniref:Inner membrane protein YbaL n=1 Tax=Urbifossiella limnaea TaxID=2528023 RepID=A0A517XYU9_9BACT|nr:cation:proton antiporter [Urbifossiella limnaea]QDU22685.1 Inner membrane protein YbaL [Urbifossiella limnaea]
MHEFPLISTIAVAFTAAWVLGLVTQRLRLSPIVGYLLAGVAIGPHTPGIQGDVHIAHQLAEVGVILLMFGVGLHFHLADLLAVKWVAIPGAVVQSLAATAVCVAVFAAFGVPPRTGAVIGMAVAVASTVVLMRVLMDADALASPAGHVAVGWLLVEDVITVVVLVMIPVFGEHPAAEAAEPVHPVLAVGVALAKLSALIAVVAVAGARVVPWALTKVARLRSRELFTLTVMVFSVAIAAGAYSLFGASMALGAFLAGMMVALSPVSHQAAADALPLRDAFAVLFFVSVGMLFDPAFLVRQPLMMLAVMAVILVVKPVVALVLVLGLGHSVRTALVVAIGLAQIGEFSFILSETARKAGLMTDDGHNVLVGGAILSITLNPLLFRSIPAIERWLKRQPRLWALLTARAERRVQGANAEVAPPAAGRRRAVVVGYGPVGRTVDRLLRDAGLDTVVIDLNMDTVDEIRREGRTAVYGDASQAAILESAGVGGAAYLVLTLPQAATRAAIVATGRSLNATLKILVRAHYLRERGELEHVGATAAIFEEAEAAVALARLVLADTGAGRERIEHAVRDIRARLILENVTGLRSQPVRNIMVPWTRVRRLSDAAGPDDVRRQVRENRFSRWPVVEAATGRPVGYLLAKDLIGLPSDGTAWTTLVRPLTAVGPDDDVESTLQFFQREGATVCVVRDGDTPVGIVTIEDVLEQVVGRFEDEYPRHPKVVLRDLLVTNEALLDLSATTAEGAIGELAAAIPAGAVPAGVSAAELAIERERDLPTNLGLGVAVPHARCPGLRAPVVVFGRSAAGVTFGGAEAAAVHLIFLLVTPAEQPNLQVLLLGSVARVAGDAGSREKLRAAATVADVGDVLAGG